MNLPSYNIDELWSYYTERNMPMADIGDRTITEAIEDLIHRLKHIPKITERWHIGLVQKNQGLLLLRYDQSSRLVYGLRYKVPTCGEDLDKSVDTQGTAYMLALLSVNAGFIAYSHLLITNLNSVRPSCEPV